MVLVCQFVGEQQGGGVGVDEDVVIGFEQVGGVVGDCVFFLSVFVYLGLEGVFVFVVGWQGGFFVEFVDQVLFGQCGEVVVNGFLRGGKGLCQFVY